MTGFETTARPLQPAQEAILFEALCQDGSRDGALAANLQTVLEISGFVETSALQRAVDVVSYANPCLRRRFGRDATGRPISCEAREAVLRLRTADLRELSRWERPAAVRRLEEHERGEEFPLGAPPLIRLLLIRTGDQERRLVVTNHRILLDGWSQAAFLRAVIDAFGNGSHRGGPDGGTDSPSEGVGRVARELPADLTRRLLACAAEHGFDAETVARGAWAFALSRMSGCEEVQFGGVLPGPEPERADITRPLGVLREFSPVLVRVEPKRSVIDLVRAVREGDGGRTRLPGAWSPGGPEDVFVYTSFETVAMVAPEPIGPLVPRLGVRISTLSTFDTLRHPMSFALVPGTPWTARLDYQAGALSADVAETALVDAVALLDAAAYAPRLPLDRIQGGRAGVLPAQAA